MAVKYRAAHIGTMAMMVLLSITLLTLQTQVKTQFSRLPNITVSLHPEQDNRVVEYKIASLPDSLFSNTLQKASAVVSMLIGICALVLTIIAWPSSEEAFRLTACKGYSIIHGTNYLFCLATLVIVFIVHSHSVHFDPSWLLSNNSNSTTNEPLLTYSGGKFDLETWACEVRRFGPQQLNTACNLAITQRWLLAPLATSNLVAIWTGLYSRYVDKRMEAARKAEEAGSKLRLSSSDSNSTTQSMRSVSLGTPPTPEMRPWVV